MRTRNLTLPIFILEKAMPIYAAMTCFKTLRIVPEDVQLMQSQRFYGNIQNTPIGLKWF